MGKGASQTNRWTGQWQMALHGYGAPPAQPVPVPWNLDADPELDGTPNQIADGESVGLRHKMQLGDVVGLGIAADQLIVNLELQRKFGHCTHSDSEAGTDGHYPHWCRAQSSGLITSRELVAADPSPRNRHLLDLYLDWWARQDGYEVAHVVPRGPLAGAIVGAGGRVDAGGINDVRTTCYGLRHGLRTNKGKQFFANAEKFADTFGALLVRKLVSEGAFANLKPVEPTLPFKLTVEHYHDGHTSRVDHPPQAGDPLVVWVRYSTGEHGTGEPVGDLGDRERSVVVGGRAAA